MHPDTFTMLYYYVHPSNVQPELLLGQAQAVFLFYSYKKGGRSYRGWVCVYSHIHVKHNNNYVRETSTLDVVLGLDIFRLWKTKNF